MPQTLFHSACLLHSQNRLAEAETGYRAVLAVSPLHGGALHRLGLLFIQTGRLAEAEACLRDAAAVAPNDALVRHHFGLLLLRLGKFADAAREADAAVALRADMAEAWSTLGAARFHLGEQEAALAALTRAYALAPDDPEVLTTIGQVQLALDASEVALGFFERALRRQPRSLTALLGRADALSALGRQEEALNTAEAALRVDPNYAACHAARGVILKQLGRFADAERAFVEAVSLAPDAPSYHRALGETRPYRSGEERLLALEALAERGETLGDAQQVELHFALFKAYDDLARYDDAFAALARGNALYRKSLPYDEVGVMDFFAASKTAFPQGLPPLAGADGSEQPVFIVGMPRSGTSLVEQMLASHPNVFGAGERTWLGDVIGEIAPDYPAALTPDNIRAIGDRYHARLHGLAPDAARISDKLPANFRHLGLIHQALPNARIIHLSRDPRDTCFSCYSKLFRSGLNFAYDLGELGRYHKAYAAQMEHWHRVLPKERLITVRYETLVGDFEAEARRIIAFCGLEWDAACLAFHENQRAVRTLSEFQVRRPLFSDSIGRWRRYEPWLGSLLAALS